MNHLDLIEPTKNQKGRGMDITPSKARDISYSDSDSIYNPIKGRFKSESKGVWGNIAPSLDKIKDEKLIDKDTYDDISKSPSFNSVLINELSNNFQYLKNNFEDFRFRQIYFSKIKENLADLWSLKQEEGYYGELLLLLNQAIEGLHAEDLDDKKVEVFEDAISRLDRGGITEGDIETLTEEFIECGISLVSPIPELSGLYNYND